MTGTLWYKKWSTPFYSSYRLEIRRKILVSGPFLTPYSYLAHVTTPKINPSLSFVVQQFAVKVIWDPFTLSKSLNRQKENVCFRPQSGHQFLQDSNLKPTNQSQSSYGGMAPCNTILKRFLHWQSIGLFVSTPPPPLYGT